MTAISVSERLLEMAAFYTPLALTVTGDQCPYSIFHEYNLVSTTVAFIGVLLVPAKVIIEHFR